MGVYMLETDVFEFNFLNFYISKTGLCILLILVHFTSNK